ncbi:MAG: hypothetical protein ACLQGV_02105 [Bryobacteraceae bacterium]
MRNLIQLGLMIAAALLSVAPLSGQCQMIYNVSVYADASVSSDLSTIYAYSSGADNSTTCNCTHSNYQATLTVYAPNGSKVSRTQPGMQSSDSMATNDLMGTYDAVAQQALNCSCFGQVLATASVPARVSPTVTIPAGISYVLYGPDAVGYNLVQAIGTPPGGQYAWSVTPANRLSFSNGLMPGVAQLQANTPSAYQNDTVLTANYTYSGTAAVPATTSTTVTVYRYLTQGSYNPISFSPPTYGYFGNVYYSVYAQPGQLLVLASGLSVIESVSQTSSNYSGAAVTFQGNAQTNSSGNIVDYLAVKSNNPLPANLKIINDQEIFVEGLYVRDNTVTFSNSTATIGNNGPYN